MKKLIYYFLLSSTTLFLIMLGFIIGMLPIFLMVASNIIWYLLLYIVSIPAFLIMLKITDDVFDKIQSLFKL